MRRKFFRRVRAGGSLCEKTSPRSRRAILRSRQEYVLAAQANRPLFLPGSSRHGYVVRYHHNFPAAPACRSHLSAFRPKTSSHTVSAPSPSIPGAKLYGDKEMARSCEIKVSQLNPPKLISKPRIRGRKVERKIRYPISRQYTPKSTSGLMALMG